MVVTLINHGSSVFQTNMIQLIMIVKNSSKVHKWMMFDSGQIMDSFLKPAEILRWDDPGAMHQLQASYNLAKPLKPATTNSYNQAVCSH